MTVFTDNGITDHEFLYGKEKEEADKLKAAAASKLKPNSPKI
jgi:hypothetical protein